MIHVKHFAQEIHACGWVRGVVPAAEINARIQDIRVDVKQDILYCDIPRTNIFVFQRQHNQDVLLRMQECQNIGIKCAYEVDDDLFNMPKEFQKPAEFYEKPEVRETIRGFLEKANVVIVSTEELRSELSQRQKNDYRVIPNCLNFDMWQPAYHKRMTKEQSGSVTIGYHASGSHNIDAPIVGEALARIMDDFPFVKLHFIGWIGFKSFNGGCLDRFKDRVKVDHWINIADLPMGISDFDIGIAPLVDNKFNRAKSNIKYLELSSEAIPMVASPMPCYTGTITSGVDGLIVQNNDSEGWYQALAALVKDRQMASSIGRAARVNAMSRWDVKNVANQWAKLYREMAA